MREAFADVLNEYMKREDRGTTQLARLTKIPRPTIVSWSGRQALRPQRWQEILLIAEKLNLEKPEADRLLQSANYETVDVLIRQTRNKDDQQALKQLQPWYDPTPFQAPTNRTQVIARETDADIVRTMLLSAPRICVLHGIDGVGKTTLAAYLAVVMQDEFPDGVLWADVEHSDLMALYNKFARAYNRDVGQYDDVFERGRFIRTLLANKKALIVLDNVTTTEEVDAFIPKTKSACTFLITSRHKIAVNRETRFHHLQPLAETGGLALLEDIIDVATVNKNQSIARQIIEHVEGLPMTIRIVGSMLKEGIVTFQEFAGLLRDEQVRDDAPVAETQINESLRASFELSYRQLTKPLQRLFSSLSVFEGTDFSVEVVTAVFNQDASYVTAGLEQLLTLSLIETSQLEGQGKGDSLQLSLSKRFRLNPSVQAFALEKARPQLNFLQKQAYTYFIEFVQTHSQKHEGYDRIDQEYDNVLNALEWAYKQYDWQQYIQGVLTLTQMKLGVIGYLDARGYWDKALHHLENALNEIDWLNEPLQKARLLANKGAFAVRRAKAEAAVENLQASLDILTTLPETDEIQLDKANIYTFLTRTTLRHDPEQALNWSTQGIDELAHLETEASAHERGNLLILQSTIYGRTGRMEEAISAAETGLTLLPVDTTPAHITGYNALSNLYAMRGDAETSKLYLDQAIEQAKDLGDVRSLAILWMNRGIGKERSGNLNGALTDHNRARQLYEQMGEVDETGSACVNMALVQIKLGEWDEAKKNIETAVSLATQYNLPDLSAFAQVALGNWYVEQGRLQKAGTALAIAYTYCRQVHMRYLLPVLLYWQAQVALGNGRFASAARLLAHALRISYTDGQWLEAGMCWRQLGVLLDTAKQYTAAFQAYEASQQLLENEDPYEKAKLLRSLGTHYLNQPNPSKGHALTCLEKALTLFNQTKSKSEVVQTEQLLITARTK